MNKSLFLFLYSCLVIANTNIYVDINQDTIFVGDKVQVTLTIDEQGGQRIEFPTLDVDGKINSLLWEFEKSKNQKEEVREKSLEPLETVDIPGGNKTDVLMNHSESSRINGIYSLQSGAFSIRENAEQQKNNLIIAGFDARISEMYRNKRILYAVRIGYFNNKENARGIGSQIKSKTDLDTIVVSNN